MKEAWVEDLMNGPLPREGQELVRRGRRFRMLRGMLRDLDTADAAQAQTRDTFAFKWAQRSSYESPAMQAAIGAWLSERYNNLIDKLGETSEPPLILDVGCGSGNSAALLFADQWEDIRYVGTDISSAVDIAADTIGKVAPQCLFMQADMMALPFDDGTFDILIAEGVLHHTPSTYEAFVNTARLVRPGGLYAFYVYAKKAPVREFTDDYIRDIVSELPPQEAWQHLMSLTKLGAALGALDAYIDVPEEVELLGIPKGPINIQRLFYWYVCKCFYREQLTLEEMNHINFDWFSPKYCHRHAADEIRGWCDESGFFIERMVSEEAGHTVIARRKL